LTTIPLQIRVLGHVEACLDDQPLALGGAKQRAILAMLGLAAGRAVSADRLIEGLWGEYPPPSAAKMVQNYVWRLRRGGVAIVTHGRGYELEIDRDQVDACRLERLVADAARGAGNGNAARAALALFRGDPLADVADEPFAIDEIRRLEELRLTAAELAIDADMAMGRHQELVGQLDGLLAANPLRERLYGQRMLALYRCDRQAEALDAYRQARKTLVDEIGIEPSAELRRLHEAILRQDPALDVEPVVRELPRELDASALHTLIGRDDVLERLRRRTGLVAIIGAYGMGKTRVAAEIAGEVHRAGGIVLYAAGTGPAESVLAAVARIRAMKTGSLLVVDDADRASVEVRAALRDLTASGLVLATGQEAAALARLEPRDSIVLEPLDAEGVRAIAGFYAPPGGEIPVEALRDATGGVPRRIHEAAGEWARHEATRRVDVAADRAGYGRTEARALEADLAGSVADLQIVRERLAPADDRAPVTCPYKGLATFDADDAAYFFGRERLVAELVARLVGAPLLAVVGPSGSGKSSVVRAGLLPALAGGVLPGSDNWTQALIRPGDRPLRELRKAARRLGRERRGVLAVDQFEELFTACRDEDERAQFVDELMRVDATVVLAVRADFYGRCAAYPGLSRLVGANSVLVGPMSRDELRRAIERPAQRVGLSVEPDLADTLLQDVEGQPGALPLLSTALLELWRSREGRHVRLAAYARSGGVQGAVARMAEAAFLALDAAGQAAARRLLLRLCDERAGGAIVRRRVALDQLEPELAEVAGRLAERRLLTISDGSVEVAHEALLREWPRLRAWLDDDVQGRRLHRQLGDAARAWQADARDPGGLYRGARLAGALDWAAGHAGELDATERAFLDDSRRTSGRAQRRLRLVLAGVASLFVVTVLAGVLALEQRDNARAEATTTDALRLGAQALGDDELDRSLLLARQAVALDDSVQTRSNLFASLLQSPAAIAVLPGERVLGMDLSPDGSTLAYIDLNGVLRLVDSRTRRPVARPVTLDGRDFGGFEPLRFSHDGSRLLVAGVWPVVLDAATLRVATLVHASEFVQGVRFSPDGRTLVAGLLGTATPKLQRFDARTGHPLGAPRATSRRRFAIVVPHLTRDGTRVITTVRGGPTVIRDARTLRPLKRLAAGADVAALSPDDRTLLLGDRDGTVRFLDLVSGRLRTASGRHEGAVVRATFGTAGGIAVTAGEDRRVIVWDVDGAAARDTLEGHAGRVTGLEVSADGGTLYSSGWDGKVLVWDLAGDRRLGRPLPTGSRPGRWIGSTFPDSNVPSHALSPDGKLLAVGHFDGTVTLTDVATRREISTFQVVPEGSVRGLAFVPGSRALVVGGDEFLARVDTGAGHAVTRLRGHEGMVHSPMVSSDGTRMATLHPTGGVMLWTLRSGRPSGPPRPCYPLVTKAATLSPDGRMLAVVLPGTGVELVDATTCRRGAILEGSESVESFARFTRDGGHIAAGAPGGVVHVWSAETGRLEGRFLAGGTDDVVWASMSRGGRTLATGSADGTVRIFDVLTQRPLGVPLPGLPDAPVALEFTPDGASLLVVSYSGLAYRWDVRPASWARHACAVAGRTLTRAEWTEVLPGRPYAPACG
jgi:WD40 repeat protein/DNA-binding SARP family transcriptional activator